MPKYLIATSEIYRFSSESEVEQFLQKQKQSSQFEIKKYTSSKKQSKIKHEIVDEWYRVEITKVFNDEREPNTNVDIDYIVE